MLILTNTYFQYYIFSYFVPKYMFLTLPDASRTALSLEIKRTAAYRRALLLSVERAAASRILIS